MFLFSGVDLQDCFICAVHLPTGKGMLCNPHDEIQHRQRFTETEHCTLNIKKLFTFIRNVKGLQNICL